MIKKVNKRGSSRVKATFVLPEDHDFGEGVHLVGDFNDWTTGENKLIRRSNKTYSTNVKLSEGERYAFRYYSEEHDAYYNDPEADAYEPNDFGEENSIVEA